MNYKKQDGAILLIAIVMLLVITIIGVTAVNSSSIKTQVAGNSMFSMLVYQGAESAISKSTTFKNLIDSTPLAPSALTVAASTLPDESITAGATLSSSAKVMYEGIFDCPVTSGTISSTIVKCRLYRVDANSRIKATNARSHHIKGVAFDAASSFK